MKTHGVASELTPWMRWLCGSQFLLIAIYVTLPLKGLLAHVATDDAYYYFEIARRFGEHPWPTFDGTHVTTGFHPLWLFILVPIFRALHAHPWLAVRVALTLCSVIILLASWVFSRVVRRAAGGLAGDITFLLLFSSFGITRQGLLGMDPPLALLFYGLMLDAVIRPQRRWVAFGLFAGLAILGRLDTVIAVSVAFAAALWFHRREWAPWLRAAALAALTVAPYLAWNYHISGHFDTVSMATKAWCVGDVLAHEFAVHPLTGYVTMVVGTLKYGGTEIVRNLARGLVAAPLCLRLHDHPRASDIEHHQLSIALGAAALLALGWVVARRLEKRLPPIDGAIDGLTRRFLCVTVFGGAAAHLLTISMVLASSTMAWYFGLETFAVVLLASMAATTAPRFYPLRVPLMAFGVANALSVMLLLMGLLGARFQHRFDQRVSFGGAMFDMAARLDATLPPTARVGSRNAGILGFAAERPIYNLDGLVNDWGFLEAQKTQRVRQWIRSNGIGYYADCPTQPWVRETYWRMAGLRSDEITYLYRAQARDCESLLIRIDWSGQP